ncbi:MULTISPECIES: DUF6492 family protein [unclassified Paenibacillus]|uniref:DUF6492 family protein n=1 Tax=unclassified Paenibacillus TaxID=185978 RepID=UPI000956429D|nr:MULTISPECIES: DUF6492 family protein [unclassified Paenibacillus]SIQ76603.1 hypothetical protein SAMN05880555_2260 [Paenibacillus sp. RU4X]SIQ98007.1 hypothetical protein SAMN05880570_2259 [Paenibacillus sp. RU4T]
MPSHSVPSGGASTRIDVLIPAIEKDLGTLPHAVQAVRRQSLHPIGEIVVVAPRTEAMQSACRTHGWRFVDENTVLPLTKKDITYRSAKWDRSGWLFQQLLKLSGDKIVKAEHFLVLDADTVLIRPHSFRSGGKTTFYTRSWSQPEYFRTYKKLMGRAPSAPRSLVTHYMLFEKSKLRELKRDIERRHGMSWHRAILKSIDRTKQFGFSEYETYGNFVYSRYPGSVQLRKALNRGLHGRASRLTPQRSKELAAKYRSVSFHERKGYVRSGSKAAGRIRQLSLQGRTSLPGGAAASKRVYR